MKSYDQLKEYEINLICDYLRRPSQSAAEDKQRRKELYDINIVKQTKTNQANQKYLSGPLGEGIVRLYFDKIDRIFIPKPPSVTYENSEQESITLKPDGLHILSDINIWVEAKMRAYFSDGTAHEKIHGVPEKYCHIGKLMLFLLADDEHKYNKHWYKLRRQEIAPVNNCEKYHTLGDLEVLHSIILGTEVADILQS
jgi:hypothetical protein